MVSHTFALEVSALISKLKGLDTVTRSVLVLGENYKVQSSVLDINS